MRVLGSKTQTLFARLAVAGAVAGAGAGAGRNSKRLLTPQTPFFVFSIIYLPHLTKQNFPHDLLDGPGDYSGSNFRLTFVGIYSLDV